jgi:hypothetical protein
MELNRENIRKKLCEACTSKTPLPTEINDNIGLGAIPRSEYALKVFPWELATNSTAAFVGSFTRLKIKVSSVDCGKHSATIHVHGENDSTLESATHLPPKDGHYAKGKPFFPNSLGRAIADAVSGRSPARPSSWLGNNLFGPEGAMHNFTQSFDWDETVSFGPCCANE